MKKSNYNKIMSYLDVIESELNKIAASVGHDDFETFCQKRSEMIKH